MNIELQKKENYKGDYQTGLVAISFRLPRRLKGVDLPWAGV